MEDKKNIEIDDMFEYIKSQEELNKEQQEAIIGAAWLNLLIGIYNIYLWSIGGSIFWNLIIGILNIGVWVFFRNGKEE